MSRVDVYFHVIAVRCYFRMFILHGGLSTFVSLVYVPSGTPVYIVCRESEHILHVDSMIYALVVVLSQKLFLAHIDPHSKTNNASI